MSDWLDFPIVEAPSAEGQNEIVHYKVCDEFKDLNAAIYRRTPLLQLWAHVVGQLPPVNNIGRLASRAIKPTLCTLRDSVACFRGVQRPLDDEAQGQSVLVYVLNPLISIAFEPDMVCLARAVRMPPETVLTIQVRPTDRLQIGGRDVTGTITRVEVVTSDSADPALPRGFGERYGERLWRQSA